MNSRIKYWLLQGFNFLGFKAAWWGCVLGAGWHRDWLGPISMLAFMSAHYVVFKPRPEETRFIIALGLLGTGLDSFKASVGLIGYAGGYPGADWLAPLWITSLWVGFGATIAHSMAFLAGRPVLAFIMGAVFGPVSYLTAAGFGAVWFPRGDWLAITVVAFLWGFSLPAMYWLANKLGVTKNPETIADPLSVVRE